MKPVAQRFAYRKGLVDLGSGSYAWLQPDGGWGWSNAGLIVDGDESLLVDTLFDLPLTREMLTAMRRAEPAAAAIGTLVNTHANGDHCHGNVLVQGAEIVASRATAQEMEQLPPTRLASLMTMARSLAEQLDPDQARLGKYLLHCFAPFDFEGIDSRPPDRTFERSLSLVVGGRAVELYAVGPAHTAGDTLVWVPADRLLFSGDILFIEGTPVMWAGPVSNWIAACDRILELGAEIIVPGHGPITDASGPLAVKGYLEYIRDQAHARFEAGMGPEEAAFDIALVDYDSWGDAERIAVNVDSLYREFSGSASPTDTVELFSRMAKIKGSR